MNKNELQEILEQHQLWLDGNGGKRADLQGADLRNAELRGANLHSARLGGADLSFSDLSYTSLRNADLHNVKMWGANLSEADLHSVDLSCADLSWINLCHTDLSGANLNGAILYNVKYNENTSFLALQCPEEGSFIGYKKARGHIVKLEILSDAKRSSATTRKCRCSAAKVLSITTLDGRDDGTQFISSDKDSSFVYQVGEIVRVDDFDENRWKECSTGIHFFITRDEAVEY